MKEPTFDRLAEVYDSLVDWPKRLKNEEPFFRDLFAATGARSVLDAACGPGHHAAMFSGWGLKVEGADLSPAMIELAKKRYGEKGLLWTVRSFVDPHPGPEKFDCIICTGNSLALTGGTEVIRKAVCAMLSALRPGGALVIHFINLFALEEGPCLWQKAVRTKFDGQDAFIIKGIHRSGAQQGYVDLLITAIEGAKTLLHSESVAFHVPMPEELITLVAESGGSDICVFGNYKKEPYSAVLSPDILLQCTKKQ